jgi:cytochrome c-type biogenesis protein CcmH/NrfG
LAIFLVKRKLKKDHSDLSKWILLAKLYEVRKERTEAIKTLKLAQRIFPRSELLKSHLNRLQKGDLSSFDNR